MDTHIYTQLFLCVFNARVLLCVLCVYKSFDGPYRGLAATIHRHFKVELDQYISVSSIVSFIIRIFWPHTFQTHPVYIFVILTFR